MKTHAQTVVEGFTDEELAECQQESLRWWNDLLLYGEAVVKAETPLGRLMEAQNLDALKTSSVSP